MKPELSASSTHPATKTTNYRNIGEHVALLIMAVFIIFTTGGLNMPMNVSFCAHWCTQPLWWHHVLKTHSVLTAAQSCLLRRQRCFKRISSLWELCVQVWDEQQSHPSRGSGRHLAAPHRSGRSRGQEDSGDVTKISRTSAHIGWAAASWTTLIWKATLLKEEKRD